MPSATRRLQWAVALALLLCVLLALRLVAVTNGEGFEEEEDATPIPSANVKQRKRALEPDVGLSRMRGPRSQPDAELGVEPPQPPAQKPDPLDENSIDPLLLLMRGGGAKDSAAHFAIRSRGWAVKQGVIPPELPPWRWEGMDSSCAIRHVEATAATHSEALPETWEAFSASGREVVFPLPVRQAPSGEVPDAGTPGEACGSRLLSTTVCSTRLPLLGHNDGTADPLPVLSVITIMRNKGAETYPMIRAMHEQARSRHVLRLLLLDLSNRALLQAWELAAAGTSAIEFILVDNGSDEDAARRLMASLRNAVVLLMGRNAHWAGGNNGGMRCRGSASTATLFWNNDAVPLPGTLAEYARMSRTMQRSAIGAVGCALQYPDGRLQVRSSALAMI